MPFIIIIKTITDKEFEQLIPPLSAEEFAGLEKDIIERGIVINLKDNQ